MTITASGLLKASLDAFSKIDTSDKRPHQGSEPADSVMRQSRVMAPSTLRSICKRRHWPADPWHPHSRLHNSTQAPPHAY
jgi:hypothetical protein